MVSKSLVNGTIFTLAIMIAAGCSSSANTSGSSKSQAAQQPAATTNSATSTSDSAPATPTETAPSTAPAGGSAFDSAQLTTEAKATSQTPVGCALPENIAKPLSSQGQLTNTSSGSWANSGSAQNTASAMVGNLNLATCPWYKQAKAQGGAYYMISYTDPSTKQTYAQLSTSVNAIAFALCLTEATAVGAVCGFMP